MHLDLLWSFIIARDKESTLYNEIFDVFRYLWSSIIFKRVATSLIDKKLLNFGSYNSKGTNTFVKITIVGLLLL